VASELDRLEFRIGNLGSRFVRFCELRCGHRQAGARRRAANESQHSRYGVQHEARPRRRNLAEEPVFDRIGRARRIVTDRDFKSRLIGEFLQPLFVATGARPVTPATVSLDHQPLRLRIVLPVSLPPIAEGICGQVWNVFRYRYADVAGVTLRIIDSVWHDTSFGIRREVVIVDLLALAAPRLASVLESANQLFLLRVHADPWVVRLAKRFTPAGDVAELRFTPAGDVAELRVTPGVMFAGV